MQREPQLDFHAVRREHIAIHDRLNNWARWCRGGRGGGATLPMFRLYRPDNFERSSLTETFEPVNSLDAADIQKLFAHMPEANRGPFSGPTATRSFASKRFAAPWPSAGRRWLTWCMGGGQC